MAGEKFLIHGGMRLEGQIAVSGGKNAAVAIIPAALLGSSPSVIENLPDIEDVHVLIEMLRALGARVEFNGSVMRVDPTTVDSYAPPAHLAQRMRASYYLAPVLLGIFMRAEVPMPGGCNIGTRAIDQTIKGMTTLGARGRYARRRDRCEKRFALGGRSVPRLPQRGRDGEHHAHRGIRHGHHHHLYAAKEPHIVDLANFLNSIGRARDGRGYLYYPHPRRASAARFQLYHHSRQIETGTLMIAAAATGGDVIITGAIPTHMEALSAKLLEMGVYIREEDDLIHVRSNGRLRAISVKTQGYPGFPTDLQQPMTALLTVSTGSSVVTENIFDSRFKYVSELERMGARIRVIDNTAIIEGVDRLVGTSVHATDLRAGAAMIVAGQLAEGETVISGVAHIDRGYERLDPQAQSAGAMIERVPE